MPRLPQSGRWQTVDPRMTMGLLGGAAPPFGILEVNFGKLCGSTRWVMDRASLSRVVVTGLDSFTADYALRGSAGSFKARIRDDGELELDFFAGTPLLKCRAVPRGETAVRVSKLAILTCVGNPGWPTGPGHGALIGDGECYTFERPNMTMSSSGWDVLKTTAYLGRAENEARPIVIQELNTSLVKPDKVMDYIFRSTRADEDFITSGWCSLQSAEALAEGVGGGFDPSGTNTPHAVYDLAKSKGLVTKSYYIWNPAKTPAQHVAVLNTALATDYAGVAASTGVDVRNW